MDDNNLFALFWKGLFALLITITLVGGGCTVTTRNRDAEMIETLAQHGVDPVRAKCALAVGRDRTDMAMVICPKL